MVTVMVEPTGTSVLVPLMVGRPAVASGAMPMVGGVLSWVTVTDSPLEFEMTVVLLFPSTSCAVKVSVP
jgi:hypothetical protein